MSAHGLQISRFGMALLVGAVLLGLAGGGIRAAAQETPDPKSEVGGLHSKVVDVNGGQARYYEDGSGEPMVMIHGGFTAGSSTANVFSRNIPELSKHFHVFGVARLGR